MESNTKSFLRSRNKELRRNWEIEQNMLNDCINMKEKALNERIRNGNNNPLLSASQYDIAGKKKLVMEEMYKGQDNAHFNWKIFMQETFSPKNMKFNDNRV